MKTYSLAYDVDDAIARIRVLHHTDLDNVTITGLFAHDTEHGDSVLTHQGYPAGAVVRITPIKDRAVGIADATVTVDRAGWLTLSQRQRDALVDHELTHLHWVTDEDGDHLCDALGRPKLKMRKHDHQYGWFDEVAQRHGTASPEVRQARRLMESTSGQYYFDFEQEPATA
jgi:Putative phage metallopeptidase